MSVIYKKNNRVFIKQQINNLKIFPSDMTNEEINEQFLKYLGILDEYNAFIDAIALDADEMEVQTSGYSDKLKNRIDSNADNSPDTDRDRRWKERKEKDIENIKKAEELYAKSKQTMNVIFLKVQATLQLLEKLTDMTTYITGIKRFVTDMTDKALNSDLVVLLKNSMELVSLKIQKALVRVKRKVNIWEIKLLEMWIGGKCCAALGATYKELLTALQYTAYGINIAVEAIQKVLDKIPEQFTVGGEGLSFFLTPKNFTDAAKMPIYNAHKSIGDYFNDPIEEGIQKIMEAPYLANNAAKVAYVTKRVSEATAKVSAKNPGFPIPDIKVLDIQELIYKAIDIVLQLLPVPQPLPKYEKLNILNIGYMMWLMTGWCRAGQVAFGLPGQIPGIPAQSIEASEQ